MQNTSAPVAKKIKGVSLRLLVVILLFILALSAFYLITNEAVLENDNQLDQFVFQNISTIVSPSLTRLMIAVTFFGSSYFLLPAYILLTAYYLFLKRTQGYR
jgi:undecaprenyl-diphosphatase